MKYCRKCGAQMDDRARFCSICGASLDSLPPVSPDSGSFWWGVLGFFVPLVGLILFLVWQDTKPRSAKKAGIGALISVISGVVLGLLSIILFFLVAQSTMHAVCTVY